MLLPQRGPATRSRAWLRVVLSLRHDQSSSEDWATHGTILFCLRGTGIHFFFERPLTSILVHWKTWQMRHGGRLQSSSEDWRKL